MEKKLVFFINLKYREMCVYICMYIFLCPCSVCIYIYIHISENNNLSFLRPHSLFSPPLPIYIYTQNISSGKRTKTVNSQNKQRKGEEKRGPLVLCFLYASSRILNSIQISSGSLSFGKIKLLVLIC